MTEEKVIIGFKIEPDIKEQFDEICRKQFYTKMSQKLYEFVHKTVKENNQNN